MTTTRWTASMVVVFLAALSLCDRASAQVVPQPGILCDDMFNSEEGLLFAPTGFGGVVPCTFPDRWPGDFLAAHDPNEKVGPRGAGDAHAITGATAMRYAVYFENLETATAPAQEVFVTDQLDAANLDLSTFSLGPITFGRTSVVPPPGLTEFTRDVDLRPAQNLIVRINARLDAASGQLRWSLLSIDPATGERPEDPLAGLLPPNVNPPAGQGSVLFTVDARAPHTTGKTICNAASIVFDLNAAIATPAVCNTFDNSPPVTAASLSTTPNTAGWHSADIGVTLSANDVGEAGVARITYSTSGGQVTAPTAIDGASGSLLISAEGMTTISFFATDQLDNVEAPRSLMVRLDKTSPIVAINAPANGAVYQAGQVVNADYGCVDALSGIAACAGPVASGAAIDTSSAGTRSFVVNAMDAAGNAVMVMHSYTVTAPPPTAGDRIAFESDRDGNLEIYTMDADGANATRLTFSAGPDLHPAWSPDRRKIAFTSFRNGNAEIYVMNADGSAQTRLTIGAAVDDDAAWSPDGNRIAFWSSRDGNAEIYVMDANGANQKRITFNSRIDVQPAWSPDGTRFVFVSNRDAVLNMDLYTMNANGGEVRRLTTHAAIDESPAWSPDGGRIVFSSNRTGVLDFEIWSVGVSGGTATPLTSAPRTSIRPAWSRDGSRISFATDRDSALNFEVYTMKPDGSDPRRLTTRAGLDLAPSW